MCLCALENLLEIVSKKWVLLILEEIGKQENIRNKDLALKFKTLNPTTLATSLKKLENESFIKRKVFKEIPPKVEYSITKKGQQLRELLIPLHEWSTMNLEHEVNCRCGQN